MTDNQAASDNKADTDNTRTNTNYSPSWLSCLIAGLAGYDLKVIPEYCPDSLIEHERKKLFRIGLSVFIPSFFGFICSYYLFGKYIHEPLVLILSATAFALLLLVVDCIIVTTLSKATLLGLIIRLAMSICIGIVVSEPILLKLYEKTIIARMESELTAEKAKAESDLQTKLGFARTDLTKTKNELTNKIELLANYSDDKIAHIRAIEYEKRKKERLASLADSKKPLISEKQAVIEGLQIQRTNKSKEIENKLLEMDEEFKGNRGSGKSGKGEHWITLNGELITLKKEASEINKRIDAANKEIAVLQDARNDANQLNSEYNVHINSRPKLTDEEQTAKTTLAGDISVLQQKQTDYRNTVNRVEAELAGLVQKYAINTRDDSLTETRVLYNIAQENNVLLIKVIALFGLIFFIDTVPTLVKLTVKTGYDDYLIQESQKILEKNKETNCQYDNDCATAAQKKIDQLHQHSQYSTRILNQTNPIRHNQIIDRYPHERILHYEVYRTMRLLADQLAQRSNTISSISIWRGFGILWAALKAKFGNFS